MAKISLRAYNREIENMIEGGQLDEAIAHCQYILKAFPMHVETYRLLGKVFLESRRYSDAADIFQRILMAVPDDFVAHVGMSIIRDNGGKLDEAIWHMERAFEVQPSNPAIQGELRRLYGRRDGFEPSKIRLSRDALANMYAQGELFNQAIAEIRSVLADDPNRPDLQVMLARAYYRAGQKVEAAEMAAVLLKRYPYCLDALRVLVDVLPSATRSENIQVYRRRLRLLDPYSSFAIDSVFASDQVDDTAVGLKRLDYGTGAVQGLSQQGWASSLKIKRSDAIEPEQIEPEKTPKSLPPFIRKSFDAADSASTSATANGAVPEWLRAVGWQESPDAAGAGQVQADEELPAVPASEADIPEWLKAMAPPEVTEAAKAELETGPVETSSVTDTEAEPDWLTGLGLGEPAVATQAKSEEQAIQELPIQEQAALASDDLASVIESSQPSGEVRSFDVEEEVLEQAESPAEGQIAGLGEQFATAVEQPEEISDQLPPEDREPFGPSTEIEEVVLEQEKGLIEDQVAESGELLMTAVEQLEEIPDQLSAEDRQSFGPSTEIEKEVLEQAEGPAEGQVAGLGEQFATAVEQPEEIPDQLSPEDRQSFDSSAREPAISEPGTTSAEVLSQEPSALLTEGASAADVVIAELDETQPAKPVVEEVAQPTSSDEDMLGWLERLATEQKERIPKEATVVPLSEETTPAAPAPATEEDISITSWLNKMDVDEIAEKLPATVPETEQPDVPLEELPDWLKDFDKSSSSPEPHIDDENLETPIWTDESAPVSEQAAPTVPEEWIPADKVAEGESAGQPEDSDENATAAVSPVPAEIPSPVADIPLQPSADKTMGAFAHVPSQDKDAEAFYKAQAALDGNALDSAMEEYGRLIKKGRLLDEVIHDLREAIYRFPVDVIVWRTLGDAYMRANRLQDALDAYIKAEELLR